MKIKFQKENLGIGIFMCISVMIFFPFIAFLSPSVAENMYASYGECDVYYKDVFYPCMSASEVFKINIKLGIVIGILAFLLAIFVNFDKENKNA